MEQVSDSAKRERVSNTSVSNHYAGWENLAVIRFQPSDGLPRFHIGLWGPETKTPEEAWRRATRTLLEGCDLVPGTRILDAGCGLGATAITLAKTFGVHVTGLTICEPHVARATELAAQRGVGDLVEFHHGDFMDLPFPDASFDVVLNQETVCYASDKSAYLRGVYRVLRPNGRWQCIDGLRSDQVLSEAQQEVHTAICRGFNGFPIPQLGRLVDTLAETGFVGIRDRDLSLESWAAIERIRIGWFLFGHLLPRAQDAHHVIETLVRANQAGSEGWLSYRLVCAVRPPADE